MSRIVNKQVNVYGKQHAFLESKALLRAFVGGIGSGKSFIGSLDVIRRSKPSRLYLVTAPTYPMLSDATFRSFTQLATQLEIVGADGIKASPPQSVKLRTGAEVIFRSTDNPETLRGPNLSGVWMDEASLSKQQAFDVLIGRLREGSELGWLTSTFTPKGKVHWTYKTFATNQPDTFLVHATSSENPFLPKEFVAKVRSKYAVKQASQELGGEFIEGGGNHYYPDTWPRYIDTGDAYRIALGSRTHHVHKGECSRILALDWAMGKPKRDALTKQATGELVGDHTAFVVADLDPDGRLFLLYCLNDRIPMGQNAPRLAEVCRRWNPIFVCGDDDNLSETMLLETQRYRDIPTVRCLPLGGRNKLVRSQAAIVRAERGTIYLPDDLSHGIGYDHGGANAALLSHKSGSDEVWVETLCNQLAAFTGADCEQDDIADAVGILGRLADEFVPSTDDSGYEPELVTEGYLGITDLRGGW